MKFRENEEEREAERQTKCGIVRERKEGGQIVRNRESDSERRT